MDQRCHTFSFGHYHQASGASCGILYILVLSLVLFMQSLYPLSNFRNFSFITHTVEPLYLGHLHEIRTTSINTIIVAV